MSPGGGLSIVSAGNTSDTGDYGPEVQRFTFDYDVDFPTIGRSGCWRTEVVTVDVTAGGVPASAEMELIKQPDPFILHGDPSWLSVDLRVFVVRAGETKFGVTMGSDASAAPGFIQQVIGFDDPVQSTACRLAEDDEAASSVRAADGRVG